MRVVNEAVYKKLTELVPDVPCYPAIAEDDAIFPYVVYNADSFTVETSKDGIEAYNFTYTVSVWSDKFDKCEEIADTIMDGLAWMIAPGVFALVNGGRSSYEGAYNQELTFDVSYTKMI